MTLYAALAYIRYKWRAKTRHGIHSPFVYRFIEQVLRDTGNRSLENRLELYLKDYKLHWTCDLSDATIKAKEAADMDVVLVTGIHANQDTTNAWNSLKHTIGVQLSIDIYTHGLLFFNKEFKEPQHFIIQ